MTLGASAPTEAGAPSNHSHAQAAGRPYWIKLVLPDDACSVTVRACVAGDGADAPDRGEAPSFFATYDTIVPSAKTDLPAAAPPASGWLSMAAMGGGVAIAGLYLARRSRDAWAV